MSDKNKRNRSFRTFDLLGLIILVGMVGSVSGVILAQTFHDDRAERAKSMTEVLARQIRSEVSRPKPAHHGNSERLPASVPNSALLMGNGQIGRDPWGHPFHFVIQKPEGEAEGQSKSTGRVFVWSDGPNGKADTPVSAVLERSSGRSHPSSTRLHADDIGHLEEFVTDL